MRIIGTNVPIHDAVQKVCGKAIYAGDMRLPDMLHAAVVFSPIPHGRVLAVDDAQARALPGVVAVLHVFNTTNRLYSRYRALRGQQVIEDECVFNNPVRFVGDRVACVVAQRPDIAQRAAKLVKVEYDPLPFTTQAEEALQGGLAPLHKSGNVFGELSVEFGDGGDAAAGEKTVSTQTHLERITHVALEPHACVADYDRCSGQLTVWSPNQSVFGIRTVLADLFDLDYNRVRVVKTTMGGSFGGKQEWILEPAAAAAALAVGRPVKLVYSRAQVMASCAVRAPMAGRVTSRAESTGRVRDLEVDITLDAGAYAGNSASYIGAVIGKLFRCYQFGCVKYSARAVYTSTPVSGGFRGWSGPELACMVEHNLNMAARALGMDPVELRLANVAKPGDVDKTSGETLGDFHIADCLHRGRELFAWTEKLREDAAFNAENQHIKRGSAVACGGHANGYFPKIIDFARVDMNMAEDGSVSVNVTIHDHGCGTVTLFQMIVAEVLELPLDKVLVGEGDTAATPLDIGCYASRTTYVLGRAAADCAQKLKDQLVQDAAQAFGLDAQDLAAESGRIVSRKDPGLACTYGDAATQIMHRLQKEVCARHQLQSQSNPGVGGAHFAQVEVDTRTGQVQVLDYVAVHDIGKAINWNLCAGQVEGAVAMGCGAAFLEELPADAATGKIKTGLHRYPVYKAAQMPKIQVEFIEKGNTEGPFGAKSIGEVALTPVSPAVVGALNQALGSDWCDLPLTPDKIKERLTKG